MYPLGNLLHPLQHLAELPRVHRRSAEVTGPNVDLIGLGVIGRGGGSRSVTREPWPTRGLSARIGVAMGASGVRGNL